MASSARPFLMFEGRAQAAMDLYTSLFPDSRIVTAQPHPDGNGVMVAVFTICGREFMCSDSPIKHGFTFTPSSSIFVDCDSVDELERAFATLSDGGGVLMPLDNYGFSRRFGWVNDRFGVSWQLNLPA